MRRKRWITTFGVLLLLMGACRPAATTTTPVLISEVIAGIQGNNNYEYIELYNTSDEIIDLEGWSLWYQLPNSDEQLLVITWDSPALIPPQGHYLLGRSGQDLGIPADAVFEQALNTSGGGLELRKPDGSRADALGWGNAPAIFTEATAADALVNGQSLERDPGGDAGNGRDTNNNARDFALVTSPTPQNSGSPYTPAADLPIQFELQAPGTVDSGSSFELTLLVQNTADDGVKGLTIVLPIPTDLTITDQPPGFEILNGLGTWNLGDLDAGDERTLTLGMTAPWHFAELAFAGFHIDSDEIAVPIFSDPRWLRVEGGVIPVGIARDLLGETVTIVGSATMYTGGFYAGSSGTKFYLQDDSGGVQVYVPGGAGSVEVQIGDQVQVTGMIDLYRGSVEMIPLPEDVLVLETGSPLEPLEVELSQAATDAAALHGRLIAVQGTVTRADEFSYSYEVDLVDEFGNLLMLYLDKLTEMSAEPIDVGHQYLAIGILDVLDTNVRLYPRVQDDIQEVFDPGLRVVADAPASVQPGETFTVTLTVFNHAAEALNDVVVWANLPPEIAETIELLDGGDFHAGSMEWSLVSLDGGGASADVRFQATAVEGLDQIIWERYGAQAEGEAFQSEGALRVFVGTGVPIWAIQGEGAISPYKLESLTTQGIVTGVFPEMFGFWIQESDTDDNEATSAGLFVSRDEPQEPYTLEDLALPISLGDRVEVTGMVREISQQTQIRLVDLSDVIMLAEGDELPPAVPLDPPQENAEALVYYEALEGMLVRVDGPALAVSPTSKYGETSLVLPYHGVDRIWRDSPSGMIIVADDGSSMEHYDRSTLPYVLQTGDEVTDLWGPLAFTYGQYKIEPLETPSVTALDRELPTLPALAENELGLMTWNVENLFDILEPHPSDLPPLRRADYDLALAKVANTILAAGAPTIVGLQEVEHLGILEDLAELPSLTAFDYLPFLLEGTDSRGIDVGYLIRGDRVTVQNVEQYPAPEGLTSRPPLLATIEVEVAGVSQTLYVLNNHFTSLSGGELATEPRRVAQAAWNADVLQGLLADDPTGLGVVMGDLNSFYATPPLDALEAIGLLHVFDRLPREQRYTYIYQGISQTLDHILVTPQLMDRLLRVEVLRTNADFAPPIPGDDSPLRKSDHDAVVVVFSLVP